LAIKFEPKRSQCPAFIVARSLSKRLVSGKKIESRVAENAGGGSGAAAT
jgi:hypothetical protein